jgi:hypothetical protein
MNADGTLMSIADDNSTNCEYWLRSARVNGSYDGSSAVGAVFYTGSVIIQNASATDKGCSPAFTI